MPKQRPFVTAMLEGTLTSRLLPPCLLLKTE